MNIKTTARVQGHFGFLSNIDFYVGDCPYCGVVYAITSDYEKRRRRDGRNFYCPNGHLIIFGKSAADIERDRADELARRLEAVKISRDAARDQAEAAERSARAYRGHLTRLRNRIASGVCPVPGCHRSFINVKAHIAGQHSAWASEHAEILS